MEIFKKQSVSESSGPKIVGGVSEKAKAEVKEEYRGRLYEGHLLHINERKRKELEAVEYDKRPYEIDLIDAADNEISSMMEKLGLDSFEVPLKNIHIVPDAHYQKVADDKGGGAIVFYEIRAVIMSAERYRTEPLDFGVTTFHELFHLKGHFVVEVEEKDDKRQSSTYRAGLGVYSSQKKDKLGERHKHFGGLEEAVTAEMEKRYFPKLIDHPVFKEQKEWLESEEAVKIKEKISKDKNISIEEIYDINENGGFSTYGYPRQRQILNLLVKEIYEDNKDEFGSENDVLNVFVKAHFDGRLLPMARLIKKSFGDEAFETLGMMTDERRTAIQTLEFLKRARSRRKK